MSRVHIAVAGAGVIGSAVFYKQPDAYFDEASWPCRR